MQSKHKEYNWGVAIFLITYQVILLATLPIYFFYTFPSIGVIIASVILLYLTGLSITCGYHRLFSHRTYKTNSIVEGIILFFGAMAGQGSALRWCYDHRIHHAFVDTDKDPYSIKKGFWYAHFAWMLEKPKVIDQKVVPDLFSNKLVMFQHRHAASLMLFSNVLAFFIVGWLFNDYWGAFFIACWTRLFALHHFTWFINSLAHTWGDKPFCQEQSAVDNYFISILTFGEGYHNYHHTYANDYRNGIRWYHFDPSKWMIWTLNKLGLAYNLKQMDKLTIKKRMVTERKNLLIERIKEAWHLKKDELEQKVNEISDRIIEEIAALSQLSEKYRQIKKEKPEPDLLQEIHEELKRLKKNIREDWKLWVELSRDILSYEPA